MANKDIYNLSPDIIDIINNQKDSEYKIFEERLDAAFKKRNIRNIAVTGNFGIGKSRFLRYYGKKRKFLFVSGCSFMKADRQDGEDEMKQVEYNLIYQLLLGCHRNVGSGALHGMSVSLLNFLGVSTGLLVLCTVFLLALAPKLEPYFIELGWYSNPAKSIVHITVYMGLFIILCIDTFVLLRRGRHILGLKSVSLELGSAKLSVEKQEGTSFFYQNRYALLRSLVNSADRIGHTVVFEDMDRLEKVDCLAMFTELWELNQEVNLYIGEGEPIRFIYVLHDQLFSSEDGENSAASIAPDAHIQLKFFDYILPIVPKMSQKGAFSVAKSLLNEDSDFDEILNEMAPYLSDYRLLRNIANEYYVFSEVEKARDKEKKGSGKEKEDSSFLKRLNFWSIKKQNNWADGNLSKQVKINLLGVVIYKNLMPEDYKKIRESGSKVLPTASEMDGIPRAVQILLNRKWLDAGCLGFIDYDRESYKTI